MALVLDASTPVVASSGAAQTVTSASFTPPAGAVLYAIAFHDMSSDTVEGTSTITDTSGLTWTSRASTNDGNPHGALTRLWTAVVATSTAMTVTITTTANGFNGIGLRVLVVTGADPVTPVEGPGNGRSTVSLGSFSQTITGSAQSWPWFAGTDWNITAGFTPDASTTEDTDIEPNASGARMWIGYGAVFSSAGSLALGASNADTTHARRQWVGFAMRAASVVLTATPAGASSSGAPVTLTAASASPYFRPGSIATALGVAGTCTITIPAGVQAGDLMLVAGTFKVATGTDAIVTPSGWTQLVAPTNATGTQFNTGVYSRVATSASAGTTVTVAGAIPSAQQINAVFAAYANASSVVRSAALANNGVTAATSVSAASASTSADDLVVYVASARENVNGPAGQPTFTGPGNLRVQSTAASAAAQNVGVALGDDGNTAGARTITASQTSWSVAGQVVLKSAANQPQLIGSPAGATAGSTAIALGSLRHNLSPNPAVGVNVTGWTGGATPTQATGLTGFPSTTGARYASGTFVSTPIGLASPTAVYTLSVYVGNNTGVPDPGTLYLAFTRSAGGDDFSQSAPFTLAAGVVTRLSITGTAPALTTGVYLTIDSINASGGTGFDVTSALYETSGALGAYFDGDSTSAMWDGVPGNSPSTITVTATNILTVSPAGPSPAGAPVTFNLGTVLAAQPAGTSPAGAPDTFTVGAPGAFTLTTQPAGPSPAGAPVALNRGTVLAVIAARAVSRGAPVALNFATTLATRPAGTSPAGVAVVLKTAAVLTVQPAGTTPRGSRVVFVVPIGNTSSPNPWQSTSSTAHVQVTETRAAPIESGGR